MLHDVGKPDCLEIDEEGVTHFYGHPKVGKDVACDILRRLRFDNYTIDLACHLIQYHDMQFSTRKNGMRRTMNKIGVDKLPYLFMLMEADILAQSTYQREEKLENLAHAKALYEDVLASEECVTLKDLAVNGSILMEEGFPKGKQMGEILKALLEEVLEDPEKNQKDILLRIAKERFPQEGR